MMRISLLLSLLLAQDITGPRDVAANFLTAYLRQNKSVGTLEGTRALNRFMSKRLIRILDDATACQKDWFRQQPKDTTDKPPFVDCCLFASSPEGMPTSFSLGPISNERDGRTRVAINYEYKEGPGTYQNSTIPLQTYHWRDALLLVNTGEGYKVDDFLFLRGLPEEQPTRLSAIFDRCRGPRYVGGK
jgi:hypothetical protein